MRILIALVLPALLGYLIVSPGSLREFESSPFERLALGFGAGSGIIVYEIFLAGLAGLPLTLPSVLGLIIAAVLLCLAPKWLLSPKSAPRPAPTPSYQRKNSLALLPAVVLIVWISLKAGFVIYGGLVFPIASQDTWWNWSGAAKFFFYTKGFLLDPANEHFFGAGYRPFLSYPLLNPLMQLWTAFVMGQFHESLIKAWSPVYYISSLIVVFFAVRREGGFYAGLVTALLLSAAPLMTIHAMDAYSDLPIAFYVLAGSIFFWRYMEEGITAGPALSGLFFAMAAFTKNEGIVYLAAGFLALTAFNLLEKRRQWKSLAYFTIPAILYIGPWLLFKAYYGIGYGHGTGVGGSSDDIAGGLIISGVLHPEVIPIFFKEIFLTINHGLVFPFLALVSIIGGGTLIRSNIKYLLFIIIFAAAVFLANYITTADFIFVLNRTGVNRNALTFLPLSFLTAGLLTSRLLKGLVKKDG